MQRAEARKPGEENERDEAWQKAWTAVERRFTGAEQQQHNIETFCRCWCVAAAQTLKAVTETQGLNKYRHAVRRANIAKFSSKEVQ